MKKLLALILALVMVMGLATVGASAATPVYSDKDDITFDEAVDVMSTVGVFQGRGDDTFDPTVELKRSEAAKIVAYLLTDSKTADAMPARGKFTDVVANHWAAGYIEYLDSQGVLGGRGNGIYDPDGKLIAIDFAKMLLVCLGYDASHEGFVGSDYKINVSKVAMEAELFKGLSNVTADTVLNRDQAAQMAFNAIKAPTVRYENRGGSINIEGANITFGASDAVYVTTTLASAQNISKRQLTNSGINNTQSGYTVEFGEKQYPTLKLDKNTDGFGRPVNDWTYGKDTIGQYVDVDAKLAEFTTAVTGADLVAVFGEAKIRNTEKEDFYYYVNGEPIEYDDLSTVGSTTPTTKTLAIGLANMTRNNVTPYWFTGNGVLTEAFDRDGELYVTSIYTYYAQANSNYNVRTGKLSYSIWAQGTKTAPVIAPSTAATGTYVPIDVKDFPAIEGVKEKDAFLVRVYKDGSNWVAGEIKLSPKTVEEKFSEFTTNLVSSGTGTPSYAGNLKGDNQYNYSKAVYLDTLLRSYDNTDASLKPNYKVVFDWNDEYVIAATPVNASTNYLFLTGLNTSGNNLATTNAEGWAILDTGVGKTININLLDTNKNINSYKSKQTNGADKYHVQYDVLNANTGHAYNRWFTYSVTGEGSSELYTLDPVAGNQTQIVGALDNKAKTGNATTTRDGATVLRFSTANTRLVGDYVNDYATGFVTNTDLGKSVAYFNQNSKIFTVGTDRVTPVRTNAKYDFTISKVTGIYTGIQGTDISGFKAMGAGDGEDDYSTRNPFVSVAWTVYDASSQYIKYAVIVGADAAQSQNYLYAVERVGSEELRSDGNYYWKLNAIVDGELKTVTVKGRHNQVLTTAGGAAANISDATAFGNGGMKNNGLFQATFDSEGNVTQLAPVPYYVTNSDTIYNNYNKTADVWTSASNLRNYKDHVVYNTYDTAGDTLFLTGRTLYNKFDKAAAHPDYMTNTDIGLAIAPDAPIFVVQQNKDIRTGLMSTDVESFTDIPSALGFLWAYADSSSTTYTQTGSRDTVYGFKGYVAAGIDKSSHTAKWVVIKNLNSVDVDNDQETNSKINASAYVSEGSVNNIIFRLNGGNFTSGSDIYYEIHAKQNATSLGEWGRMTYGWYTMKSNATEIAFGAVSSLGLTDKVSLGGITSANNYYIVIMEGNKVYKTNEITPFGS